MSELRSQLRQLTEELQQLRSNLTSPIAPSMFGEQHAVGAAHKVR